MQIEYGHIYYVKNVGSFAEKGVIELQDEKTEIETKSIAEVNSKHPLFKTITENLWTVGLMEKFAGFEKSGKYSIAWAELGQVKQEIGYWRITGNWIEVSKTADNALWIKTYEVIKSVDNTIVLKNKSETFSPSEIPLELRKE